MHVAWTHEQHPYSLSHENLRYDSSQEGIDSDNAITHENPLIKQFSKQFYRISQIPMTPGEPELQTFTEMEEQSR